MTITLINEKYLLVSLLKKIKFKVINPVVRKAFKSPNYLGAQLWNMLPLDTQSARTYNMFKYKVKRHIAAGLYNNMGH